jgi:hypothetical protein
MSLALVKAKLIALKRQDEDDTDSCGRWHKGHRARSRPKMDIGIDKESCCSLSSQTGRKERWTASRCFELAWTRPARAGNILWRASRHLAGLQTTPPSR